MRNMKRKKRSGLESIFSNRCCKFCWYIISRWGCSWLQYPAPVTSGNYLIDVNFCKHDLQANTAVKVFLKLFLKRLLSRQLFM